MELRYQVYIITSEGAANITRLRPLYYSQHKTRERALCGLAEAERFWMETHDECDARIWDSLTSSWL